MLKGDEHVVVVTGGGDWADASVDVLITPRGFSQEEKRRIYKEYRAWHLDRMRGHTPYVGFEDWLVQREYARKLADDDPVLLMGEEDIDYYT